MPNYEEMAQECSALMDAVEAEGINGSSDNPEDDPRFQRISELANLLNWFAPHLLDKRFLRDEE